jgi:hypothetical protein
VDSTKSVVAQPFEKGIQRAPEQEPAGLCVYLDIIVAVEEAVEL